MPSPRSAPARALALLALVALASCQAKAATSTPASTIPPAVPEPIASLVLTVNGKASPVLAWSAGQSNTISAGTGGGGASAGRATLSPLTVQRLMDAQSPALFATLAAGNHYPTVLLEGYRRTEAGTWQRYLAVFLEDVLVKSISTSGGGDAPMESVDFVMSKYSLSFDDGTGPVQKCWDVAGNLSC